MNAAEYTQKHDRSIKDIEESARGFVMSEKRESPGVIQTHRGFQRRKEAGKETELLDKFS